MAVSASRKSWAPRGCRPARSHNSSVLSDPSPSTEKTPRSIAAVRSLLRKKDHPTNITS